MKQSRGSSYDFIGLFIFLVGLLLFTPLFPEGFSASFSYQFLFSAMMLWILYMMSHRKGVFCLGVAFALPSIVLNWSMLYFNAPFLPIVGSFCSAAFLILMLTLIIYRVFGLKCVDENLIFGGICIYLLMGMLWTEAYALIEWIQPGSFLLDSREPAESLFVKTSNELSDFMYYSFVTLTTLGYGDIVPLSKAAKFYSILEALFGQLFIATVIARLVSLLHFQLHHD